MISFISVFSKIYKYFTPEERSLQAQPALHISDRLFQAPRSATFDRFDPASPLGSGVRRDPARSQGSVTLEATLITPIWLCAVCAMLLIAQMLIAQAAVQYSVSKTAERCAKQFASEIISGRDTDQVTKKAGILLAFADLYGENAACTHCILGGKPGVTVAASDYDAETERVTVRADYVLRCPVPFFNLITFRKTAKVSRHIDIGYVAHGKGETDENDPIVYLTNNQEVYHTSLSCTHLSLKISDPEKVAEVITTGGLHPCAYCCHEDSLPATVYVTANGDAYHASLSCGGLTRSIRAVHLSEVKGLRMCSRCAAKQGG